MRKPAAPTGDDGNATEAPDAALQGGRVNPDDLWFDYFKKRQPSLQDVQKLVSSLHRARKHDHVIAVINAALANGQSQPWMYDILALSMEIDGRPQEDIERVLLSRVDFTTTDIPSLIRRHSFVVWVAQNRHYICTGRHRDSTRLERNPTC